MDYTDCENIITSNDYLDAILKLRPNAPSTPYNNDCSQIINDNWLIAHNPIGSSPEISLTTYGYSTIPKLFGLMDTTAIDAAGITRVQNQPVLNLSGQNVIIGFVDTGIDYTHEAFINNQNKTKILSIWDQTINTGAAPEGYLYGTEFTQDMLNEALASDNPLSIVPTTDTNGHGTFLAGVAAGYQKTSVDFSGAAFNADIIMVKLKPAKKYLLDYYMVKDTAIAYQENDIMLGIKYLREASIKYKRPLVICIGLGCSQSGHIGETPLEDYLDSIAKEDGFAIICATGNEGNERHHHLGIYNPKTENIVEIRVGEKENGFMLEMWVNYPDTYSIEIVSPLGNRVPGSAIFRGETREYSFILETTKIYIDYHAVDIVSGQQVITMRFVTPTPGIWQIKVIGEIVVNGTYNLWLPIKDFLTADTYFVTSNPTVTLTAPSSALRVISVGGYNHNNNSFFLNSGRGYTADNVIKPDIVAPSVSIQGPLSGSSNQYTYRSGTSIGSAITAGGAALILEWGLINNNASFMNTRSIKSFMIKGARRSPVRTYPNPEFGFGELYIYNIFTTL